MPQPIATFCVLQILPPNRRRETRVGRLVHASVIWEFSRAVSLSPGTMHWEIRSDYDLSSTGS